MGLRCVEADKAQLYKVYGLAREYYDAALVILHDLKRRAERYPHGVRVVERDAEVIGFMTLWPLTKQAFDDILAGRIGDSALDGEKIMGCPMAPKCEYWYCMGYVVTDHREDSSLLLLYSSLSHLVEIAETKDREINIVMTLERPDEAKLLAELGFTYTYQDSADKAPIYHYVKSDYQHLQLKIREFEAALKDLGIEPNQHLRATGQGQSEGSGGGAKVGGER